MEATIVVDNSGYTDNLRRAAASLRLGRFDVSIDEARKALAADPNNPEFMVLLGGALLFDNDSNPSAGNSDGLNEALACVEQGLGALPEYAMGHQLRGMILGRLDRHTEATEASGEAIRLEPNKASFHSTHAELLAHLNDPQATLAAAEQAISLDPNDPTSHTTAARACMQLDEFDRANSFLEESLKLDPECSDTQQLASALILGSNKTVSDEQREAALRHAREALRLDPTSAVAHQLLVASALSGTTWGTFQKFIAIPFYRLNVFFTAPVLMLAATLELLGGPLLILGVAVAVRATHPTSPAYPPVWASRSLLGLLAAMIAVGVAASLACLLPLLFSSRYRAICKEIDSRNELRPPTILHVLTFALGTVIVCLSRIEFFPFVITSGLIAAFLQRLRWSIPSGAFILWASACVVSGFGAATVASFAIVPPNLWYIKPILWGIFAFFGLLTSRAIVFADDDVPVGHEPVPRGIRLPCVTVMIGIPAAFAAVILTTGSASVLETIYSVVFWTVLIITLLVCMKAFFMLRERAKATCE